MDSDVGSCLTSLASSPTCCSPASVSAVAAQPLEIQDTPSSGAQLASFVNHIFSQLHENVGDQYWMLEKLGEGAVGVVRRCIEKSNGRQWACKTISKSLLTSQEHVEALIDEVEIQTAVGDHGVIVGLHDVLEDDKVRRDTWQMPFQCGEGNTLFTSGGHVTLRHDNAPFARARVSHGMRLTDSEILYCNTRSCLTFPSFIPPPRPAHPIPVAERASCDGTMRGRGALRVHHSQQTIPGG